MIKRILQVVALAGVAGTWAQAQAPAAEKAVTVKADDKALAWGGCPEFMPKGCAIAVLNGDPSKNNSDVFFKVPSKAKIPMHWHTSAERMILVKGTLKVAYEGQPEVTLEPGSYAYGPAKKAHSGYCASKSECILFIAFESPVDAVASDAK